MRCANGICSRALPAGIGERPVFAAATRTCKPIQKHRKHTPHANFEAQLRTSEILTLEKKPSEFKDADYPLTWRDPVVNWRAQDRKGGRIAVGWCWGCWDFGSPSLHLWRANKSPCGSEYIGHAVPFLMLCVRVARSTLFFCSCYVCTTAPPPPLSWISLARCLA